MLSGLHDVAWNELRDAHGPATGIPGLLTDLSRGSDASRATALAQLALALCPGRRAVSEAAASAIPFLVALAAGVAECRPGILALLDALAEVSDHADDDASQRVRLALLERVEVFVTLLRDADADVRGYAALTAASLLRHDDAARRELASRLSRARPHDPAPATRLSFLRALERLGETQGLTDALNDPAPAVRLEAALAVLGYLPDAPRPLAIVAEALAAPERATPGLVPRLCSVGAQVAEQFAAGLLARLAEGTPATLDDDLVPLLTTFLPRPTEPPTRHGAALLATLAQHRAYFGTDPRADLVLKAHGLPPRPRALRALAARGPSDHGALVPALPELPAAPLLLDTLLAGREPACVTQLALVGTASDALCGELARLVALEQLVIKGRLPTAEGLEQLGSLAALASLRLEDGALDARGASALLTLKALRKLTLVDVDVTPDAEAILRAARGLSLRKDASLLG